MKMVLLVVFSMIPLVASAGGLLGDVTRDLGRIADDKSLTRGVSEEVSRVSGKIERAALVQKLQEDALGKRIVELEGVVRKQQEIISRYEKVVAELEIKLGNDGK